MYKNNSRFSSKSKSCSQLQLSCNLIGKPVNGYYYYTNRSTPFKKMVVRKIKQEHVVLNFPDSNWPF